MVSCLLFLFVIHNEESSFVPLTLCFELVLTTAATQIAFLSRAARTRIAHCFYVVPTKYKRKRIMDLENVFLA